jgi:methyl-accepting chemotaxis protein
VGTERFDGTSPRPVRRPRLPLGYQVILGVSALVVLLLLLGIVSVGVLFHVRSDEVRLGDASVPYTNAVAAASLEAKGIANDQRGFLLTGRQEFVDEIASRTEAARQAFSTAAQSAPDPTHGRAVAQASAGFEQWVSAVQSEIATYRAGDHAAATAASLDRDRSLRKSYEQALANAQALGDSAIQAGESAEQTAFHRGLQVLVVTLALALVGGSATAVWLVRSIALPVYRLVSVVAP